MICGCMSCLNLCYVLLPELHPLSEAFKLLLQVPEGAEGKVGVTGSGKGLTEYRLAGKHQFNQEE